MADNPITSSSVSIGGSSLGNALQELLNANDIQPGDAPSYSVCKAIYTLHPLGAKMVERPVKMAMEKPRTITVPAGPEMRLVEEYTREWKALKADDHIKQAMYLKRVYGIASLMVGSAGVPAERPLDPKAWADLDIHFNIYDPLNTAGSLVLNQDPNSPDFQRPVSISVAGKPYHRSRACVVMNEQPIYIAYTSSAFGYVGRSVYQRALFPLKSYLQTMITNDLVQRKAGVFIAKIKQPGAIIDTIKQGLAALKRTVINVAQSGNTISITPEESIETLNMQNVDTAMTTSRRNIIMDIASACDMPAKILLDETYAEGFGEGSEDAKYVAKYISDIRGEMQTLYDFMDRICRARAWSPAFYRTIQDAYPDSYRSKGYTQAFYEWTNSFTATWPSLLEEPESEQIKVEETKYKTVVAILEVLLPLLDPINKARAVEWAADNLNEQKKLFTSPLVLDYDALAEYEPPQMMMGGGEGGEKEPPEPKPFAAAA